MMKKPRLRVPPAGIVAIASIALGPIEIPRHASASSPRTDPVTPEYLGQATLTGSLEAEGERVGGLSGMVYDPESSTYLAISDDKGGPGTRAPKVVRLRIDLGDGRIDQGDVTVEELLILSRADGSPVPPGTVDAEGIARGDDGTLFVASEGMAGVSPPSLDRFDGESGRHLGALPVPGHYRSGGEGPRGVRGNLGFESLCITPSGRWLIAGTENALVQDGPKISTGQGSPSRLLRIEMDEHQEISEYIYWTEPIVNDGESGRAGLTELLAIGESRLLALERSFTPPVSFSIRLFEVDLDGATNIAGMPSLAGISGVVPARKRLVLDLADVPGVLTTNLEGMAFGPDLPDGRRLLVMVGDNNLIPLLPTQFLAFAIDQ